MSEQEFELYLKLLARCLNLTSDQRGAIADELRDHLEERLQELALAGVPREKAVFQALDEFGDAAALAAHFTRIARLKRRRFLMRLSLGSVVLLAAGLLVAFAFWPEHRVLQGPPSLFADANTKPAVSGKTSLAAAKPARPAEKRAPQEPIVPAINAEHPLSSDVGQYPRIEAALEATADFTIEPEGLKDAVEFIAQRYQIPILFDTQSLDNANIDTSIEVKMPIAGLKVRQLLALLLRQLPQRLGFDIQDGVLQITTVEKLAEHRVVVVYDCRDLIHLRSIYPTSVPRPQTEPALERTGVSGGGHSGGAASAPVLWQPAGAAADKPSHKNERNAKRASAAVDVPLINVIQYAGDPGDWDEEGGPAKITEIGGLLVVYQNPMVHQQVKRILADLRRMKHEGAFATLDKEHGTTPNTPVPAEKDPPASSGRQPAAAY